MMEEKKATAADKFIGQKGDSRPLPGFYGWDGKRYETKEEAIATFPYGEWGIHDPDAPRRKFTGKIIQP